MLMPYFGSWPEWFELYLESCRWNPQVTWHFFTDCGVPACDVPPNVTFNATTLKEFLHLTEKRVGVRIDWENAYKICDLRPAFGQIFSPDPEKFEFWGWGDIDVIYGDFDKFFTDSLLNNDCISFSKRHLSGHFCIWRNNERVCTWYRRTEGWRERMESAEYTHLDECEPSFVPSDLRVYAEYSFNTPLSPHTPWTEGTFNCPNEWLWKDGALTNDLDGDREFLYLHFMQWKGGWWPRHCGNAQWEKLDKLVHLDPGECKRGFKVTEFGFFNLD